LTVTSLTFAARALAIQTALFQVEAGITDRAALAKLDNLSKMQQIGLKYFDDIEQRIPRAEVAELHRHLEAIATRLFGGSVRIIVCGSFRRGKKSSGDCDCERDLAA